jgi:hypothetical protein
MERIRRFNEMESFSDRVYRFMESTYHGSRGLIIASNEKELEVFQEIAEKEGWLLYDDYYVYKHSIMEVNIEGFGSYGKHYVIKKIDISPIKFKENLLKKIESLEDAFNKIDTAL